MDYETRVDSAPVPEIAQISKADKESSASHHYSIQHLIRIRDEIESSMVINQIGILRILVDAGFDKLTEKSNGVFLNMIELDKATLDKIGNYLICAKNQNSILSEIEEQSNICKNVVENVIKIK